jgi:hypothetical protein
LLPRSPLASGRREILKENTKAQRAIGGAHVSFQNTLYQRAPAPKVCLTTLYLLAFLSIISEMEEEDFQMGRTRSCVNLCSKKIKIVALSEHDHLREVKWGQQVADQHARGPINNALFKPNDVAP